MYKREDGRSIKHAGEMGVPWGGGLCIAVRIAGLYRRSRMLEWPVGAVYSWEDVGG